MKAPLLVLALLLLASCHGSSPATRGDAGGGQAAASAADSATTTAETGAAVPQDSAPKATDAPDAMPTSPDTVSVSGDIAVGSEDPGIPITTADVAYLAVWASSAKDVWAGGKGGRTAAALQHWDGAAWKDFPVFPSDCLVEGIWGTSPSSVWAVGCTNTILHWDGVTWQVQPTPAGAASLFTLRGFAEDDVWAGGWNGLVLHWDGHAWQATNSGTTRSIARFWTNSRSDAWLVAGSGSLIEVRHWDGKAWAANSMVDIGDGLPTDIFAPTADDIWLSSWDGLFHFDGKQWGIPPTGKDVARGTVFALWGRSASQIYAGSFQAWRFDGNAWTVIPTKEGTVRGIWGVETGEAWFVGDNGYLGTYKP